MDTEYRAKYLSPVNLLCEYLCVDDNREFVSTNEREMYDLLRKLRSGELIIASRAEVRC